MNEEQKNTIIFNLMLALLILSAACTAFGILLAVVWSIIVGTIVTVVALSGLTFSYFWFTEPV